MKMKKITLYYIILIILFASCSKKNTQPKTESLTPIPVIKKTEKLILYNNDILPKINSNDINTITKNTQNNIANYYFNEIFSVWHQDNTPDHKTNIQYFLDKFQSKENYGENKMIQDNIFVKKIENNINISTFPNFIQRGITLRQTSIRTLPYDKPIFSDFSNAGGGYPFDDLQGSILHPATPIRILHMTQDKKWVYISSNITVGWVLIQDIAFVDDNFIQKWENNNYVRIINENIPIIDSYGIFRYTANIGSFFPMYIESESSDFFSNENFIKNNSKEILPNSKEGYMEILVVSEDEKKNAVISKTIISKTVASANTLEMRSNNAIDLILQLNNQNYGWGGLYGNRDCSGLLRDYFSIFGFFIPKYSLAQYNEGNIIDLSSLDRENKKSFIIKNAIPFFTILYKKGHVMLYLGSYNDDIIIFHSIWGLRTISQDGTSGREIIGKSVISSLELDKNLDIIPNKLIDSITGMVMFTPAKYEKNIIDFLSNNTDTISKK